MRLFLPKNLCHLIRTNIRITLEETVTYDKTKYFCAHHSCRIKNIPSFTTPNDRRSITMKQETDFKRLETLKNGYL